MNKVYACIDGLSNTDAVIDWAAWAALRVDLPLEFLHVLERHPERAETRDYSGSIGVDAQESLLQELSDADARHAALARESGRRLLAAARERAAARGATQLDARLRHGEFVETVLEMEPDARLYVLGEHPNEGGSARSHFDRHLDRVVRAVKRPVLVATAHDFAAPQRLVIAYDGSAASRRTVENVARSRLLAGLPALLAMVADDTTRARRQLGEARDELLAAGFSVQAEVVAGEAPDVLPALVKAQGPALLVMGAFGHSRLRQLVFGSTTSTLLRLGDVPALVVR